MKSMTMDESELFRLIFEKHPPPAWACFSQVRNGTGFRRRTTRTADAVAMSLYPSRGLELHGFEIKSRRNDWTRELNDPAKAESIADFCDRWWVVAPDAEIVPPDELPPAWGLMVVNKGKLKIKVQADRTEAKPLDRLMVASLLRKAEESFSRRLVGTVRESEIEDRLERERERGERQGERTCLNVKMDYDSLKATVDTFEAASGVKLDAWRPNNVKLGEVVKKVLDAGLVEKTAVQIDMKLRDALQFARNRADRIAEILGEENESR